MTTPRRVVDPVVVRLRGRRMMVLGIAVAVIAVLPLVVMLLAGDDHWGIGLIPCAYAVRAIAYVRRGHRLYRKRAR